MAKYSDKDVIFPKDIKSLSDAHKRLGVKSGLEISIVNNFTVSISSGVACFGTNNINFNGGQYTFDSSSETNYRKDIVSINSSGQIVITKGDNYSEKIPSGEKGRQTRVPIAPNTPSGNVLLYEVFIDIDSAGIENEDINDMRQIIVDSPLDESNVNHDNLNNVGFYTHDEIDSHIDDNNIHFSQGDIDIGENQINNLDKYSQSEVDDLLDDKVDLTDYNSHVDDTDIHYTQSAISIIENQISDLDKYTQSEVDNLLDDKVDTSTLGDYRKIEDMYASARQIYVSKENGDDSNGDGKSWDSPFETIERAIEEINILRDGVPTFQQFPYSIIVETGNYTENNPLTVPRLVSIIGTDLRTTRLYASNPRLDYFHCNDLNFFTNLRFYNLQSPAFCMAFPCSLARPVMLNGSIDSVEVLWSREGYDAVPEIVVDSPEDENGTLPELEAVLTDGVITSINVIDGGSGYTIPPSISIPAPSDEQPFITGSPYPLNCSAITGPFLEDGRLLPVTMPLPYDINNPGFNPIDQVDYDSPVDSYGAGGGIRIDGRVCLGWNNLSENSPSVSPLRSFVTAQFTQVNQGGPGHLLTNGGFAQFVSSFTTFCSYGFRAVNGGFGLLSNSVSDFGLQGLVAEGKDSEKYSSALVNNSFTSNVSFVNVIDGGSGYTNPTATFSGGGGSGATANVEIEGGEITNIVITDNGSGYTSTPTLTISDDDGSGATFEVFLGGGGTITIKDLDEVDRGGVTRPLLPQIGSLIELNGEFYTIETYIDNGDDTYDLSVSPNVPTADEDDEVTFFKKSVLNTGGHIFEYAGTGVTYNALPEYGGVVDNSKQVIEIGEGRVYHTSSDEQGNFRIGSLFSVDQNTGEVTISTDRFNLSGLNAIGPFKVNNQVVGVQLRELSNRNDLQSNSGLNGNSVITISGLREFFLNGNRVIPNGGTSGQVLSKASSSDRDVEWSSVASQGDFDSHVDDNNIHFTQGDIDITESQINDLDKYTQSEVDNLLDEKVEGVGTAKITVSDTEPSNPSVGDIWIDTSGGN